MLLAISSVVPSFEEQPRDRLESFPLGFMRMRRRALKRYPWQFAGITEVPKGYNAKLESKNVL